MEGHGLFMSLFYTQVWMVDRGCCPSFEPYPSTCQLRSYRDRRLHQCTSEDNVELRHLAVFHIPVRNMKEHRREICLLQDGLWEVSRRETEKSSYTWLFHTKFRKFWILSPSPDLGIVYFDAFPLEQQELKKEAARGTISRYVVCTFV